LLYEGQFKQETKMKKLLSMSLEEIYLDYLNNFATLGFMAEYYGVDEEQMYKLYIISRDLYCTVFDPREL